MGHSRATAPLFLGLSSLLAFAGCTSPTSSEPPGAAATNPVATVDTRAVITCADAASQESAAKLTYDPGSWGTIPAGLQHVPPGGTFCGLQTPGELQSALLLTTFSGQLLLDFYAPFLTQLGCTTEALANSYSIHCEDGSYGLLQWEAAQQVAFVSFSPAS